MNSENKKHELGESLIDSIIEPNTDVITEMTESLLDELLEGTISEAAQEIPILKSIVGIAKAGIGMKDYFFLKKLILFLSGVHQADEEISKKLCEAYKDPKVKQDFGEQILMTIDRLETLKKIDALIKIFSAFAKGDIDQQVFFRYSYVLENIDFNNLNILVNYYISEFNFIKNTPPPQVPRQDRLYTYDHNNIFVSLEDDGGQKVSWRKGNERKNDYFLIQNFINVGLISVDNYSVSQEIKKFIIESIEEVVEDMVQKISQSSSSSGISSFGITSKISSRYLPNPSDDKFFMGMDINEFGIKFLEILEIFYKEETLK
ncbi:MAG: hypothetical protein DCF12_04905 [Snowella sp.]|nr:MAG: hypothetical protein DCF12_04905 [Snowella sp.]